MEPVKDGTLVNMRPEMKALLTNSNSNASVASWAVRFAASLDGVVTVLSGMSDYEQMKDNISYMNDFKPLTNEERTVLKQVVEESKKTALIQCTGCRYCVDGCPKKINIPTIFTTMNEYRAFGNVDSGKKRYAYIAMLGGKASDCLECGSCESHCPQKLSIIENLKEAVELFE